MEILSGVDMVEIDRIKHSIENFGSHFKNRVYTQLEIAYCESKKASKFESYAGRFAAKEAVSKALGTGIGEISLHDIEVVNDQRGVPQVILTGFAKQVSIEMNVKDISLSISHCKCHAVAFAVMIKECVAEGEQS